VQGNKIGDGSVAYISSLDLHQAGGRFSAKAETILRDAGALILAR
jgi:hypothetical protein